MQNLHVPFEDQKLFFSISYPYDSRGYSFWFGDIWKRRFLLFRFRTLVQKKKWRKLNDSLNKFDFKVIQLNP